MVSSATSHPKGPVYLWGRREVMEAEVDASVLDTTGQDLRSGHPLRRRRCPRKR